MNSSLWTVLLAAGQGTRLAQEIGGQRKQFLSYAGAPLYWFSLQTLAKIPALGGIVVVFPEDMFEDCCAQLDQLKHDHTLGLPIVAVAGGQRRQDSVRLGLRALPSNCQQVLVHDAARPFVTAPLVQRLLKALQGKVSAVIPALPLTDTIKEVHGHEVRTTLERHKLRAIQTPQLFKVEALKAAHDQAVLQDWIVTDDAALVERMGLRVVVVDGDAQNIKITTAKDLAMLDFSPSFYPCTGFGYDVHAYGGDRPLVLGGIPIAGAPQVHAHSDGDVLLHALCDALLGCLGLGDIGTLFPDSDQRFENISSAILLSEILEISKKHQLLITHVDLTIIAQVPRLAPHREAVHTNIALLLGLRQEQINVKASTEERLGFTGRKEGIKAVAVVTGVRPCS